MANADDHELASRLAAAAGDVLVELRIRLRADGADERTVKDEGDRVSHELLTGALREHRPDDAVLSEEARGEEREDTSRLDAARVWIIDPLDGTREYGEGRDDWAVHVALVEGGVPTAGAVALPGAGLVFDTRVAPVVPEAPATPRVVVSRSRPPAEALQIAAALGADLVEMGSAGAKTMSILRGDADVYPHSGGQFEWDSAAPVAVAMAAGLHCSRLDGSPLVYNRDDPYLPDLLICRPQHAAAALAAARDATASESGR
ncbi:MAG: 3'(2'),5'-bisphosphate nucleotidase CysQ [Actinomycetota bacterium]|nr:3'(2'),5'-bisphosphate nucleotidase CysQ [Actinomycetota bacterium]